MPLMSARGVPVAGARKAGAPADACAHAPCYYQVKILSGVLDLRGCRGLGIFEACGQFAWRAALLVSGEDFFRKRLDSGVFSGS